MAYKEMDDKTLKKLHEVGLEVLKEVDRVCKKYDIPYFLCGGTLIGVMRHKGFIPWDDDIDVGMLRKDYERFEECYIKEHSKDYYLHSYNTDSDYWVPFMKLRKNNTTINEKMIEKLDTHKGIYVDIFPFDTVPDKGFTLSLKINSFLIKLIIEAVFYKKKLYKYKDSRRPFITWLTSLLSFKTLKKIQHRLLTKYSKKDYEHCICYVGCYNTSREYIKKSDIYPTKKGLFEGCKFYIPIRPEVYLTNMYGDYMKLPPKDQRKNHNPVNVDFKHGKCLINGENDEN